MILIQNQKLQKALDKVGLGSVKLYRDNGFFFIASDNRDMADIICSMYSSCIYYNSFGQQTIKGWVEDIQALFNSKSNF